MFVEHYFLPLQSLYHSSLSERHNVGIDFHIQPSPQQSRLYADYDSYATADKTRLAIDNDQVLEILKHHPTALMARKRYKIETAEKIKKQIWKTKAQKLYQEMGWKVETKAETTQ